MLHAKCLYRLNAYANPGSEEVEVKTSRYNLCTFPNNIISKKEKTSWGMTKFSTFFRGNFRYIWFLFWNFSEFSVEWFAFRKFDNFRISGIYPSAFVPFVFVLKISEFLVKWKVALVAQILKLFSVTVFGYSLIDGVLFTLEN